MAFYCREILLFPEVSSGTGSGRGALHLELRVEFSFIHDSCYFLGRKVSYGTVHEILSLKSSFTDDNFSGSGFLVNV